MLQQNRSGFACLSNTAPVLRIKETEMRFIELGLAERLSNDLEKIGFIEPTEIQAKTIPAILAGHDIMASAETGSGKTAAYALPIINGMRNGSKPLPRALILVPTRELAVQVNDEIVRFANKCGIRTATIYGGVSMFNQIRMLKKGVDVIVATPGRLFDHITQGNVNLSRVQTLVLDEADRMLDMGFTPQVRQIVARVEGPRQTIMFSATINKGVEKSGEEFLTDPVNVFVNTDRVEPSSIDQRIHLVEEEGKTPLLVKLLSEQDNELVNEAGAEPNKHLPHRTVLVFTKTRHRASKICKRLNQENISAGEIHSDISQNKRESTLKRFRAGEISVLVATDIAARGLDIPAISHVINFDLPLSAADYVHRIGRTGRAGRSGIALSFVSGEQRYLVRDIEKVTGRSLDPDSPFGKVRSKSNESKNYKGQSKSKSPWQRQDRSRPEGASGHQTRSKPSNSRGHQSRPENQTFNRNKPKYEKPAHHTQKNRSGSAQGKQNQGKLNEVRVHGKRSRSDFNGDSQDLTLWNEMASHILGAE